MSTCSTCVHWAPPDSTKVEPPYWHNRPDEYGVDVFIHRRKLGMCHKADTTHDQFDKTTLAVAYAGGEPIAEFYTATNFGCVMHEPKET